MARQRVEGIGLKPVACELGVGDGTLRPWLSGRDSLRLMSVTPTVDAMPVGVLVLPPSGVRVEGLAVDVNDARRVVHDRHV